MLTPHREALAIYWKNRRDVVRFAILFRLFEAFLFTPAAALVGRILSGQSLVDSTDLVGFVRSPRGFAATFLGATLLLTLRLVEQTGLSAIMLGAIGGQRVTSPAAMHIVARLLPRLLVIAGWILLAGLALVAPLLAVAGLYARDLLARHDINYYLAERPPQFLMAAAVIIAVAIPTLAAAVWLAVRWRLTVPVALCEPASSLEALRSSARWARGAWRRVALAWLATEGVILGLELLAAWLGRMCSLGAALLAGEGAVSQVSIFAGLLIVHTLLTGFITLPGPCIAAGVFAALYRDIRRERDPGWNPTFSAAQIEPSESRLLIIGRWLLGFLPVGMAGLAFAGTILGMGEIYKEHLTEVTAHRGGTLQSIENTLEAVREAIAAGAQFAEIDVQMSRDEVLVVTHDSDFSRQAGRAQRVWDLTYDEIREIPLTHVGSPQIAASRAPTLDEVLDAARGKIHLNIELKYYGDRQPRLAERVVEAVRAKGQIDQVIIQSLHYAGLEEVRRLAPEMPIGYLFSVNAREPKRLEVDFLSVQLSRVKGPFINAAHRRKQQVHVWTVDKPADMERLIDLGADNLITNRPEEAVALVREHENRSPAERALRRVRVWLTE